MGKEIERKFLVINDKYKSSAEFMLHKQGYLSRIPEKVVRVRTDGKEGYITVKGERKGAFRKEYEYRIPIGDALEMLDTLCDKPLIEKKRYIAEYGGFKWEIDEFYGENEGLVIAEIELESEDACFSKPDWIGEEVTDDNRYYNSNLVSNPYSKWNF